MQIYDIVFWNRQMHVIVWQDSPSMHGDHNCFNRKCTPGQLSLNESLGMSMATITITESVVKIN